MNKGLGQGTISAARQPRVDIIGNGLDILSDRLCCLENTLLRIRCGDADRAKPGQVDKRDPPPSSVVELLSALPELLRAATERVEKANCELQEMLL